MNIALMHYHLKSGGVTTVLRQQAAAMQNECRVCILTGEPADAPLPVEPVVVPELAYRQRPADAAAAAAKLSAAIGRALPGGCDILHVHNPTLTKNVDLLQILKTLQQWGQRLLLQIHDFAEDGRPQAFAAEAYPSDCHYAVINSRDFHVLQCSGLKPRGLHLLPNMIDPITAPGPPASLPPMMLYPVRAIRRKNIGEAILLSLLAGADGSLGITLPPHSPADRQSYRDWQRFAGDHHLPIRFELGRRHELSGLMAAAGCVVTTSVSEGFGFAYLEPWLYGKSLTGRRLPDICSDFEKSGISLEPMYSRLRIPLQWLNPKEFRRKWSSCLQTAARRFGLQIGLPRIRTAFETLTGTGDLDFGLLDEAFQRQVIAKLIGKPALKDRLRGCNPFLKAFASCKPDAARIQANRQAVMRHYAGAAYRRRLLDTYRAVIANPVAHRIDKAKLAEAFLHPPAFSLLKWSAYGG